MIVNFIVSHVKIMSVSITPETECLIDGYFHESEFRSAPYFAARIDGITELN